MSDKTFQEEVAEVLNSAVDAAEQRWIDLCKTPDKLLSDPWHDRREALLIYEELKRVSAAMTPVLNKQRNHTKSLEYRLADWIATALPNIVGASEWFYIIGLNLLQEANYDLFKEPKHKFSTHAKELLIKEWVKNGTR